jgi:hypothetical protein
MKRKMKMERHGNEKKRNGLGQGLKINGFFVLISC